MPNTSIWYWYSRLLIKQKEIASEEGLPYQILRKDHYAHIVKDIPSGTVGYVMFETLDNIKDDYLLASDAETLILLRPTDKRLW